MSQKSSGRGGRESDLAAVAPPVAERNPWLVLAVLCLAVFMLLLDTTIVNVAQREIQLGLDATLTQIQWVLDSYILSYAVLLLSFGRMGDIFGRKRLFILGMSLFTAASALCAASSWLGDLAGLSGANALISARVLQGIGGAFMMPQSLSLISVVFPPEKRGAAMGIWGSIVALGAVIGPIVGGLIVTNYAWEWIFLINIPIGVGAILATIAIVPESKDPLANRRLDWGGLFLSGFGIFALVFALIEGGRLGWTDPPVVSMFFVGVLLLIAFVSWEKRATDPMVKLELFGQRNFLFGNLISLLVAFGMLGIFFPMTLFLQGALGFSPIRAGLTMTPMSIMIMIAAPFAGRLTDRIGARWILVTGLLLMTGGILFITSRITLETSWRTLWPALMVTGTGMGMTFAPMTAVVMMDVPGRIAGSASGILNTTRNIGQVLGIALLGSLLQSRMVTHTSTRLEQFDLEDQQRDQIVGLARNSRFDEVARVLPPELSESILGGLRLAFVDSLHNTFIVSAVACFFGALAAWQIRNPARRQAPVVAPATESAVRAG